MPSADRPPKRDLRRMTPRSLKRTLLMLRKSGAVREGKEMADRLCTTEGTLNSWEGRSEGELIYELKLVDLQRYQDTLGIPTGIILLISQILAASRDGNWQHLAVMAGMMQALAARIDTPRKRKQSIADAQGVYESGEGKGNQKTADDTTFEDWDNFLVTPIGVVWGAVSADLRRSLLNPARMRVHDDRKKARQERMKKQKAEKRNSAATSETVAGAPAALHTKQRRRSERAR